MRAAAKNAAPLAIGLAFVVGVFAEGPFTGGSMNPARTLGPALAFGQLKHVWVYLVATFAGGACAALTYDKLFLEDIQVQLPPHCRAASRSMLECAKTDALGAHASQPATAEDRDDEA